MTLFPVSLDFSVFSFALIDSGYSGRSEDPSFISNERTDLRKQVIVFPIMGKLYSEVVWIFSSFESEHFGSFKGLECIFVF